MLEDLKTEIQHDHRLSSPEGMCYAARHDQKVIRKEFKKTLQIMYRKQLRGSTLSLQSAPSFVINVKWPDRQNSWYRT